MCIRDSDDVYADVTNTEASYITIKKGVDNATALKIKEADLAGVDITCLLYTSRRNLFCNGSRSF